MFKHLFIATIVIGQLVTLLTQKEWFPFSPHPMYAFKNNHDQIDFYYLEVRYEDEFEFFESHKFMLPLSNYILRQFVPDQINVGHDYNRMAQGILNTYVKRHESGLFPKHREELPKALELRKASWPWKLWLECEGNYKKCWDKKTDERLGSGEVH